MIQQQNRSNQSSLTSSRDQGHLSNQGKNIQKWIIFTLASMLFILSMFYRASVTVIAPKLTSEMMFTASELSILSAAFFYAFAFTQIPISLYLDRLGPRWMMSILSFIGVLGAFLFSLSHSLSLMTFSRILLGIGMACNLMGTLKLITLWFGPRWFATLSALVVSLGTAGSILATTPLVFLERTFGWRYTFAGIGGVNLLFVILFFLIVRDHPTGNVSPLKKTHITFKTSLDQLKSLFAIKDYWIISTGTFVRYGVLGAVQSLWAGPYLMDVLLIEPITSGNILFIMNIGIVIGCPLCGWISDAIWTSRKKVIISGIGGMVTILIFLSLMTPGASVIILSILFFLFGVASSAGQTMYAHIKERVPIEKSGTAMTGVNFFTMMGGGIFLQAMGGVMDFFFSGGALSVSAYKGAFLFCAIALSMTAIIYGFSRETLGSSTS